MQVKRWQSTVGRPDLQAFYGALAGQKAKRSVFITTSGFTAQAVEFALSVEGLVLVDGKRLVNLMLDHDVGVSSQLYKVPRLDSQAALGSILPVNHAHHDVITMASQAIFALFYLQTIPP